MRRNFNFVRLNFKGKLFYGIGSFLFALESDIAGNFIAVFNLNLLDDPLRRFRRHQCPEIENPLIHEEDI